MSVVCWGGGGQIEFPEFCFPHGNSSAHAVELPNIQRLLKGTFPKVGIIPSNYYFCYFFFY